MGLCAYSIFLVRELGRGPLLADLERVGLVSSGVMLDVPFAAQESRNELRSSCPLSVVELALGDSQFAALLSERPDSFIEWLWLAVSEVGVAYAFIPGGGDFPYYEQGRRTDAVTVEQLGELVETGAVRVVHPLMLFAARTGVCDWASKTKSMLVEMRAALGCLLILGERDPESASLDLFEPATLYERVRDEVLHLQARTTEGPSVKACP